MLLQGYNAAELVTGRHYRSGLVMRVLAIDSITMPYLILVLLIYRTVLILTLKSRTASYEVDSKTEEIFSRMTTHDIPAQKFTSLDSSALPFPASRSRKKYSLISLYLIIQAITSLVSDYLGAGFK